MIQMYYDFLKQQKKKEKKYQSGRKKKMGLHVTTKKEWIP